MRSKTITLFLATIFLLGVSGVVSAYKSRVRSVETFNQGVSIFDDFLTPNANVAAGEYTGLYFESIVSGGTISSGSSETYPGYVELAVTTLADRACLTFGSTLFLSNSSMLIAETRFNLDSLMAAGNNSEVDFGFGLVSGGNLSTMSSAVVFTYDKGISDNFRMYHKTAGVVTQEVLNFPVEAGTDYYLKLILAGDRALFLIDNVYVGSLTLSVGGTVPLRPMWFLEKNLDSSASQNLTVDAIGVYQQFVTPRTFSNTVVTQ